MYYLGVDIGSSSSKVALIDENGSLKCTKVVNKGTGTSGVYDALSQAFSELNIDYSDIKYTVATGYGRLRFEKADIQITEITCHAKGVNYLIPEADTIVDIGGQDAKSIKLGKDGRVDNFMMNEKCAAGTGRFMEVVARVLSTSLDELSNLADKATEEIQISSVCTVFAESEIISKLSGGETLENVARGANMAVAKRVAGMCMRSGIGENVVMTGGVALNSNMVNALGKALNREVKAAPFCQSIGAIGAACFALEKGKKRSE